MKQVGAGEEPSPFNVEAFAQECFRIATETVEWNTCGICYYNAGLPHDIRTGVLVQIGDSKFIVSAAHGLQEACVKGEPPRILQLKPGSFPIPLLKERFYSSVDPREDLVVAELSEPTLKKMGTDFKFLRVANMISKSDCGRSGGLYLLLGHARDRITRDESGYIRSDMWKYFDGVYAQNPKDVSGYSSDLHLLVNYEENAARFGGKFVAPYGLSGCGVWRFEPKVTQTGVGPSEFQLAAIQTFWDMQNECIRCTWSDVLLTIIWKYFPKCRNALQINGFER